MKRDYKLFIKDMIDAIDKIESFIAGMNFSQFRKDDKTSSAVAKKLEDIGEAAKNVPPATRSKYKDLPWSEMARMRDKIIHFYFGIDYEIVWKVVKENLPEIKTQLKKMLADKDI